MSQIEEELDNVKVITSDQSVRSIGFIILLVTFGVLGTWSYFAPLSSAAIAPGTVTVKFNSKTVQHLEGGIVKRIHAQEGVKVEAGDVLIEMDITKITAQKEQLNNDYIGLKALNESYEEQVRSYSEEIKDLKELLAEGFVDKKMLRTIQREHSTVVANAADTAARLRSVTENLIVVEDMIERSIVKSPVEGTVLGLKIHTEGGSIAPRTAILDIVPDGQALTINARVSPQDIDRVHIGLKAEIRFSIFNQSTTPTLYAEVVNLSADSITDQNTGLSYYRTELEFIPESVTDLVGLELLPGMQAEVLISTGERTLIEYLGKPISDSFARSMLQD